MIYNFDWTRAVQNRDFSEKSKLVSETLLELIHNFIVNKINTLECINKLIKLSLQKRSILTKIYHSNPTVNDKEALDF